MSVPLRAKLMYAFCRVAERDAIFSHVFQSTSSEVEYGTVIYAWGDAPGKRTIVSTENTWLMASKVEGNSDIYKLYQSAYTTHNQAYGASYVTYELPGIYTRGQAKAAIAEQETSWLATKSLTSDQPFKKLVKTYLSAEKTTSYPMPKQ